MKIFSLVACLALIPVAANADAKSDQLKAFKKMGIGIPHPPALCNLITKSEAARFLGEPVRDGESAGPISGCAYRSIVDANAGVLVTRGERSDWYPPTNSKHYAPVQGIGEHAYTDYTDGLGYEATALNSKGVTSIQMSGKGNASRAIGMLRIAMNR
jgi:hypothetical protein